MSSRVSPPPLTSARSPHPPPQTFGHETLYASIRLWELTASFQRRPDAHISSPSIKSAGLEGKFHGRGKLHFPNGTKSVLGTLRRAGRFPTDNYQGNVYDGTYSGRVG